MKKLFFITANFIWLFCSCSTQELVINTEEVYYKDVNSVNYNYITSPVEAVSYRETQDSTIFGVVVLEDGHTVCVSITNPILLQNIIGKDYTYIEKYTIETMEIYLKNLFVAGKKVKYDVSSGLDVYLLKVYDYNTGLYYTVQTDIKTFLEIQEGMNLKIDYLYDLLDTKRVKIKIKQNNL